MSGLNYDQERRKQNRLQRLGTNNPICALCGEKDWRCFERHHIAGKAYDDAIVLLCTNCHAKASDIQKDHTKPLGQAPFSDECIAHFLQGLADLLILAAEKLIEFSRCLLEKARNAGQRPEGLTL